MGAWADERDDLIRAFSGAYIFGIPLLFTMEMWWIGEYVRPGNLLTFLAVALAANLGLTWVAGFKRQSTFRTTVDETIEVVAIGVVAATVMLLILNQLRPGESPESALGKVVMQAVPLSIGASVTNQVFGTRDQRRSRHGDTDCTALSAWQALATDIGATTIGGVFIGVSIAPTEEIPMIAAALDPWHLLGIVAFSLLLSYGIVFASGFRGQVTEGPFQRPFTETMLSYVISLLVSLATLYLFGQIAFDDPVLSIVEQVLVLGVPTTVGGAAGRLVI